MRAYADLPIEPTAPLFLLARREVGHHKPACQYSSRACTLYAPLRCARAEEHSHVAMQRVLNLDRTFRALADGTVARYQPCTVRLAVPRARRQFHSAQPTISNHLKVLERAGLVNARLKARTRFGCAAAAQEAADRAAQVLEWAVDQPIGCCRNRRR